MKIKPQTMIGIDIDDSEIRVLEVSKHGKITKMGQALLAADPSEGQEQNFEFVVSSSLKKAMRNAHLMGNRCSVVLGGPNIILRRFTFPDLPEETMLPSVKTEIETYLPSPLEEYTVDYRVVGAVRPEDEEESDAIHYDVLVAAVPKTYLSGVIEAVKKQGMRIHRVDLRENVREKFSQDGRLWKQLPSAEAEESGVITLSTFSGDMSYAVLNVTKQRSDVTVCINGKYYVNRYITGGTQSQTFTPQSLAARKDATESEAERALDKLVTEVGSIIDYAYYRERKSRIKVVQLFGQAAEMKDLQDKLWNDINVSSVKPGQLLYEKMPQKYRIQSNIQVHDYLDAYAVTIEEESTLFKDFNLYPRKAKQQQQQQTSVRKPLIAGAAAFLVVLGAFFGWFVSYQTLNAEKQRQTDINNQILELTQTSSGMTNEELREYIEKMNGVMTTYIDFGRAYPNGRDILNTIQDALGNDVSVYQVKSSGKAMSMIGMARDDARLGEFVETLRESPHFSAVTIRSLETGVPPSLSKGIPNKSGSIFTEEGLCCVFTLEIQVTEILPAPAATASE